MLQKLLKTLAVSVFLIFLFSCSNIFDSIGNEKNVDSLNKLTISSCIEYSSARSAVPSSLPSNAIYFASLSYVKGEETKYVGDGVANSGSGGSLIFIFDAPAFEAETECYLTVYAFQNGSTFYKAGNIASGTTKGNLKPGQISCDFGNITLNLNSEKTGNGTAKLEITNSSGGTISVASVVKDGTNITHNFAISTQSGKTYLVSNGMPRGSYTITLSAKDASDKAIELENPVQVVNIFAGLVANKWVYDGNVVDSIEIKKITYTTFYVCGSSPSWYGDTKVPVPANGVARTGSITKPFTTLKAAVDKCTDTSKQYTIYVDGTTTETSGITISVNTTIKALGSAATIERGSGNTGSMITVSQSKTLTLEGITIDGNEHAVSGNGAGIKNSGTLTLKNSKITKCYTTDTANYYGGAIFSAPGSNLNLYGNTELTLNKARFGGAIGVGDETNEVVTVIIGKDKDDSNVKIHVNTAYDSGGAIMGCAGARITMNAGEIYENTASSSGGALYLWGGKNISNVICWSTFTMNSGSIYKNRSLTGDASKAAGAVYIDDGQNNASFIMNGGTIYDNTATNNYAIWHAAGSSDNGQLKISGSAYIAAGNDIYLGNGKVVTVTGELSPKDSNGVSQSYAAYITSGASTLNGTAVIKAETGEISSANCEKFKIKNTGSWGVVQSSANANVGILKQVIFVSSTEVTAAASYTEGDGSKEKPFLTVKKALDSANTGALIYVRGTVSAGDTLAISNKTITVAKYPSDSANPVIETTSSQNQIFTVTNSATLNLTGVILDGSFGGNIIGKSQNGAGIYVDSGCTVKLTDSTIQKCKTTISSSSGGGGGIYTEGTVELIRSTIQNCSASYGNGGGIYVTGAGVINLREASKIIKNSVSRNGGGLCLDNTSETASTVEGGSIIAGNSASTNGGGIYQKGKLTLGDCNIGSNEYLSTGTNMSADTAAASNVSSNWAQYGAGIYIAKFQALSITGTANFNYNYANSRGGGIYCYEGPDSIAATALGGTKNISYNGASNGAGVCANTAGRVYNLGSNVTVTKNKAISRGGGMYLQAGIVILSSPVIKNNNAGTVGGIYVDTSGNLRITSPDFANNTASNSNYDIYNNSSLYVDGAWKKDYTIYCESSKTINVQSGFSGKVTLTPSAYTLDTTILTGTDTVLAAKCNCFVIPDNESKSYYINTSGKLNTTTFAYDTEAYNVSTAFNAFNDYVENLPESDNLVEFNIDSMNNCSIPSTGFSAANKKIKLTATTPVVISANNGFIQSAGSVALGDNITLTLHGSITTSNGGSLSIEGCTIETSNNPIMVTGGSFSMSSGTIKKTEGSSCSGIIISGGEVNITGGTIDGFGNTYQAKYPIEVTGGSGTIGCTVTNAPSSVYIAGGTWNIVGFNISNNTLKPKHSGYAGELNTSYGAMVIQNATITLFKNNTITNNTLDCTEYSYLNAYGGGLYISDCAVPNDGGNIISNNDISITEGKDVTGYGKQIYCSDTGTYGGTRVSEN